jgi:quercetin dioxygenase-like cupin family protein
MMYVISFVWHRSSMAQGRWGWAGVAPTVEMLHRFLKGWKGTTHSHPHEQVVYVVSGRIQFDGDDNTIELRTGDSVIVEGNVEHQATALEDSDVLDVFAPYREDYAQ